MRIEIIILIILFILHFIHLFRTLGQIRPTLLYANSVLESARLLQKYYELEKELIKYPTLKEFMEHKINLIDILNSVTSFNEIIVVRATKKEKWSENKINELILEVNEASEEVKLMFFRLLELNNIIFKNSRICLTKQISIKGSFYYWILTKILSFEKRKYNDEKINSLNIIENLKTV